MPKFIKRPIRRQLCALRSNAIWHCWGQKMGLNMIAQGEEACVWGSPYTHHLAGPEWICLSCRNRTDVSGIWLKFALEIPHGLRHNPHWFTRAYIVWIRNAPNFSTDISRPHFALPRRGKTAQLTKLRPNIVCSTNSIAIEILCDQTASHCGVTDC